MQIKSIISFLESIAPASLQESYDNSGLIVGKPETEVESALLCLDCTEEVIQEAISKKAGLVIAHHPIVFSGLKRFNGANYVQRAVELAIKHDIAIYAIHTNLDNVLKGVNDRIAERLGLINRRILQPIKGRMLKLVVFCPVEHSAALRQAMWDKGCGNIGNYDECSFNLEGTGTFRAAQGANPFVGKVGETHFEKEVRIEVLLQDWNLQPVLKAMRDNHPYEEVAYDIYRMENEDYTIGSGLIAELPKPMPATDFLAYLKEKLNTGTIRYTQPPKAEISKIALCGGSGSFLLGKAMQSGADVLVTADFKYHQFFDAEGKIMIADIGHFESEQFTLELIGDELRRIFPKFATHFTSVNTNPINYF